MDCRRLHDGTIGVVLIISRFEDLNSQIESLERRGVHVMRLMRQPQFTRGKATDHRQLLFSSAGTPRPEPLDPTRRLRTVFPNVPHEDTKDPRDLSYDQLRLDDSGRPADSDAADRRPPAQPSSSASGVVAESACASAAVAAHKQPNAPLSLPSCVPELLHAALGALSFEERRWLSPSSLRMWWWKARMKRLIYRDQEGRGDGRKSPPATSFFASTLTVFGKGWRKVSMPSLVLPSTLRPEARFDATVRRATRASPRVMRAHVP